jgi:hypothetical protein
VGEGVGGGAPGHRGMVRVWSGYGGVIMGYGGGQVRVWGYGTWDMGVDGTWGGGGGLFGKVGGHISCDHLMGMHPMYSYTQNSEVASWWWF